MPIQTLELPSDRYIWDCWFAQHNSEYHLFYLHAPKTIANPELRHWNVAIGHACSTDLQKWELLPDALHPGPEFEKYTWTGSTLYHRNQWYLFFSYSRSQERGLIQRVGVATSTDAVTWHEHPEPIIEADPRYYEQLDLDLWHDQSWRDPWVFQHPSGDFYALITARANHGHPQTRGVIALARALTPELLTWEVLPPIAQPQQYGAMECPQLVFIDGRYYLIFSSLPFHTSGEMGTYYMVGDAPLGPFSEPRKLCVDPIGRFYAGKLLQSTDGEWYFVAWRNLARDCTFLGDLIAPVPVRIDRAGYLSLPELQNRLSELQSFSCPVTT
ncbi:MAG: glycosyl hydrolase family 32 [Cyanophyceae cyanobacterium]